tara:strand:+ start:5645 stop:6943 length:1299 start_codon:yes stop_codon:yes gene_type:complete
MKPLTFFLSSTIYDFKDLRSAIKYYLEQQGCRVLASEFNDFPKSLDKHSYAACLESISQADYFVLLIGSRVGGWFDKTNRISITQREYREAYRLQQAGRIKLLSFVRADVWRMKDDRKLLARHLEELGFDPGMRNKVLAAPTKAATDAEFITGFIDEVGRNRETASAASGSGQFPIGNWLNQFETFKDVIEPIQVQAFAGRPIEETAMKRLLRDELREILRKCLVRGPSKAISPRNAIYNFYATLPRPLCFQNDKPASVNTKHYRILLSLWIQIMQKRFFPQILPEAVKSSAFMEYDPVGGDMKPLPVHSALVKLQVELIDFSRKDDPEIPKALLTDFPKNTSQEFVSVDNLKLLMLLHSMDRWCNIVELSRSIIVHLDGMPFVFPNLRPQSPFYEAGELDKEVATTDQIDKFLAEKPLDVPNIRSRLDLEK